MDAKKKDSVRIELTDEQKRQLREQTGHDLESLELTIEELEPRIAPRRDIGFFL
jgi:hypothetical protein